MSIEQPDLQLFRMRARRNPLFFAAHIPVLVLAAARKIKNRIRMLRRDTHLGAKETPLWIDRRAKGQSADMEFHNGSTLRLPIYSPSFCLAAYDLGAITPDGNSALEDGDMEAFFETHRWRFLAELSVARRSDVGEALARVRQWITAHHDRELAAWEPYSACERVANLLVWLACVRHEGGDALNATEDLKRFVEDSLGWIAGHLEYYGDRGTNNHILNNARALVMGGVAVGHDWSFRAGMRTFREFLPRLVAQEGFLRERSSHYQLIVANWVLDAWRFVDARFGADDPDTLFLREYSLRMVSAAALLCDERGELFGLIGDVSPDASPQFTTRRLATLYPETWSANAEHDVGCARIADDWFRLDEGPHSVVGNFPPGNFPPSFPTHGHGDHTGFVWRVGDVPVLVDSGRYRYTADSVSVMQTGALGHSIPLVNGFPPLCESLLRNGLWWPRPYATATMNLEIDGTCVRMSHDGFARATPVRVHARKLEIGALGLAVEDRFEGTGTVMVRQRWNFGIGFEAFDGDKCSVSGPDGAVRVSVSGFVDSPVFRVRRAEDTGGWYSEAYGVKAPSLVLEVEGHVSLPVSITTDFEIIHVRNSRRPAL